MTEWKAQIGNGRYSLQFETDDYELFKLVQKSAQKAMDESDCKKLLEKEQPTVYPNISYVGSAPVNPMDLGTLISCNHVDNDTLYRYKQYARDASNRGNM